MNPTDPRDDLSAQLNAAHAAVNAGHARERRRLLARLPSPRPAGPRTSWRYVLGGVSLAASLAIAVFFTVVSRIARHITAGSNARHFGDAITILETGSNRRVFLEIIPNSVIKGIATKLIFGSTAQDEILTTQP